VRPREEKERGRRGERREGNREKWRETREIKR
jgi:hypothetical protein